MEYSYTCSRGVFFYSQKMVLRAGITMFTSLVSSYTGRRLKNNINMTGEITLRGKVLPVGGIKEKILAKRSGIKEIILSSENKKDVLDINQKYLKGLKFHYVMKR